MFAQFQNCNILYGVRGSMDAITSPHIHTNDMRSVSHGFLNQ